MPASNRRPLWEDGDAPQPTDTSTNAMQAAAAPQPPAPASSSSSAAAGAVSPLLQQQTTPTPFKQPCTLKGAASALYAGMLGYFLGFVPATIKFKARQWGMIHTQGLASAQQLGVMTGMYTAIHCICQRIRMVEDGWNRGIAGCSTGLVLGWSNGPVSAFQSCAGLGLISALIDLGGGVEAAEARELRPLQQYQQQHTHPHHVRGSCYHEHSRQQQGKQLQLVDSAKMLSELPQPAQLLALLLGMPPSSLSAAVDHKAHQYADAAHPSTKQQQQPESQQQDAVHSRSGSQLHVGSLPAEGLGLGGWSNNSQSNHQQALASAAAMLQPAAHAMQQLIAAPPLMFLGACCLNNNSSSSSAAAPAGGATAATDVDACPVWAGRGPGSTPWR